MQVKIDAHFLVHAAHGFGGGVGRSLVFIEHKNRWARARDAAAQRTGRQGEADRLARRCRQEMRGTSSEALFQGGLHEYLGRFIADIGALDRAISQQFRFT